VAHKRPMRAKYPVNVQVRDYSQYKFRMSGAKNRGLIYSTRFRVE